MKPEDDAHKSVTEQGEGTCAWEGPDSAKLLRCACGSLLARYVAGQIELKCRRCKRTVLIPIEGLPTERDRS